jgi:hypothetical protein
MADDAIRGNNESVKRETKRAQKGQEITGTPGKRYVGVVDTGLVGLLFDYAQMIRVLATEVVLVEPDNEKAVGGMMDYDFLQKRSKRCRNRLSVLKSSRKESPQQRLSQPNDIRC